ncbi:MAG TPA: alpha/beta hydrolase fold domain-containing protein [Mycobacteriales bacterium]|nr:alpha/beta hydrolase fold domain-containing protein [Mycobacteriales bacterium]
MTDSPPVVLEPAAKQFADANANPPYLYQLDTSEGRKIVDDLQSDPPNLLDADLTDLTVPGGPAGEMWVRIVRPPGATGTLPVILYIHGLGWVFGNSHTHDRLVRELAVGANAAVVFPEYSLSPEARYPTAIEEIDAVAAWVVESGAEHGLDPTRVVVAGDSVGCRRRWSSWARPMCCATRARRTPTSCGRPAFRSRRCATRASSMTSWASTPYARPMPRRAPSPRPSASCGPRWAPPDARSS